MALGRPQVYNEVVFRIRHMHLILDNKVDTPNSNKKEHSDKTDEAKIETELSKIRKGKGIGNLLFALCRVSQMLDCKYVSNLTKLCGGFTSCCKVLGEDLSDVKTCSIRNKSMI